MWLQYIAISQQHAQTELLLDFNSDDASLIMDAGRLHTTRCYGWLETRKEQAPILSHLHLYVQLKFVDL